MANTDLLKEANPNIPADIATRFQGKARFIAYDCVLLERFIKNNYVYTAVNMKTGQREHLCRRTKTLTKSSLPSLLHRIRASHVAGVGRYSAEVRAGSNLFHQHLAGVLVYVFTELLPTHGYNVREKQVELASHILVAMKNRSISLAEAEVGTGKTHAYLIAAALIKRARVNDPWLRGNYTGMSYAESHRLPVVISTSSIALQNAIVNDYLPEISKILLEHEVINRPLTCMLRKGKEHYICDKRLNAYYYDVDAQTKQALKPLLTSPSADLADTQGLTAYTKARICVSGVCGKECRARDLCRYQRYMRRAQEDGVDFQVCNHNYFLADLLHRAKGQQPLIPHYQAVVMDEAHKFLDAARQMYGVQLERGEIPSIVKDVLDLTFARGESRKQIDEQAQKMAGQNARLFKLLEKHIPEQDGEDDTERFKADLDTTGIQYLRNMHDMAEKLFSALWNITPLPKYINRRANLCRALKYIMDKTAVLRERAENVYWLEKPPVHRGGGANRVWFCAIPKNLGSKLNVDLWKRNIPVVLTSGTLSASGDFTHTKRTLGLDLLPPKRLEETTKPSPFNHRENAMLYISETVPFPDVQNPAYIAAVADEVHRLVTASHGHAAVLFTSYKAMDKVCQILETKDLPFPLLRMGRGGNTVLDNFRESRNAVLFASGSLWEGIDLPGDILSLLVIVKLPFAVPDPISEYEQTLYPSIQAYKNHVTVPEMLIKLKQGFGRLIRSENDTGVVALLDSRARMGGSYRQRVLDALPDCRTTSNIPAVERFFKEKKALDYFA